MDDAPHPIPEQLGNAGTPEERRTGLGGSDAPAALGLSPWRSRLELWEEKVGLAAPQEQNEPMLWGSLLEDVIRREYARRTGLEVKPVKELIRHPKHEFMFAHIDGIITGPGNILEVKTARDARGWGDPQTDEIPDPYLVQVNHYLACCPAAEACDVAVLIGGQDFRIYQVRRDPEIEAHLIEQEAAFWDHVVSGQPPPPTTVGDAVRRWGRFNAQGYTVANDQVLAAIAVLRKAHAIKTEVAAKEEEAKLLVMSAMGETGQTLVHPYTGEVLCTWKLDSGRRSYTVAAREPARRLAVKNLEEELA